MFETVYRALISTCFMLTTVLSSLSLQDSFPLWFRAVHVINQPRLFNVAYQMFKPFLSEQIKDGIIFHTNVASLHEHIGPEMLFEEYGGKLGPFDNAENFKALEKLSDYFDRLQTYRLE